MLPVLGPHQGRINTETVKEKALGASKSASFSCCLSLVLTKGKINTDTVKEKALGANERASFFCRLSLVVTRGKSALTP